MSTSVRDENLYGLMACFATPEALVAAAQAARQAGYVRMDAYSPMEVHGLDRALDLPPSRLPRYVLIGGLVGALTGYVLQYYAAVVSFPWNVGGRPNHSWPSFIILTFELTILFAGLTAAVGMIVLCHLPRPYHPVFNVSRFTHASRDRFFLCIEAQDPKFNRQDTRGFLEGLKPEGVDEVER